jgi:hypothetical protein
LDEGKGNMSEWMEDWEGLERLEGDGIGSPNALTTDAEVLGISTGLGVGARSSGRGGTIRRSLVDPAWLGAGERGPLLELEYGGGLSLSYSC